MIGVPALMVSVLVAVLAMWAWGPLGASGGGVGETAMLRGMVEITQRDANGNVLFHQINPNSVTTDFLENASDRLKATGDPGATGIYDAIQLCAVTGDACSNANVVKKLGTALNTGTTNNPAQGAITDGSIDGIYVLTETFFCNTGDGTACTAIAELQLVAGIHTGDFADTDVGALQAVTVTLADNDELTVTWTITIS